MNYIWCISRGMWWKPNKNGYTKKLSEAGKYTDEESQGIVSSFDERDEISIPVSSVSSRELTDKEREKGRSSTYYNMTPEEQWAEDKRLGILDWNGQ